ncbi:MAG: amine oxidase [Kangiella sp.]|nr:MAG: amine oxidase [Kangiella sp.]
MDKNEVNKNNANRNKANKNKLNKNKITRRNFLSQSTDTLTASTLIRVFGALGLANLTTACGSSSATESSSTPNQNNNQSNNQTTPRPVDWPGDVGTGKKVIILGAGISGLVSAYEMTKLGYECTILEATGRVGGRVRTIRNGDVIEELDSSQTCVFDDDPSLYFNAGAARIPTHHDLLLGYCREFNVALEIFVNENTATRLHSNSINNSEPLLNRQVVNDTQGYIAELLASALNSGSLDSEVSSSEKSNLLNLLKQFAGLDNNYAYFGSQRTGFVGQENSGSQERGNFPSPILRSELFQSEFNQFKLDFFKGLNQQATMLQPVGGMDNIAKAFELQVFDQIIFEAQVTEIRKTSNGVNITYIDEQSDQLSIQTDYCICTIPAPVLKDIANDFSNEHQSEIESFSYSNAGKLAFQSNRFWEVEHNIYGGISWTDQDITQIWYPSHGVMSEDGIIIGAYTFGSGQGTRFSNLSPSERITTSIDQANLIHSEYESNVINGVSISWPKIPFQLGGWGTSVANILLTEDQNIFFAGEHLSILQGWQEGAILSAYSAIDLIVLKDSN